MNLLPSRRLGGLVGSGLLAGLLCVLAFAPFKQPLLAWIFPVPLVVAFFHFRPVRLSEAAACGAAAGLFFFGVGLFWLTEVTTAGWVALVLFCTFFHVVWCLVLGHLVRELPELLHTRASLVCAFFGAGAFTALEWIRGWIFTGFSWNSLGVSQIGLAAVSQIAELGGVHLLSWLVVFCGMIFALTGIRLVQEARHLQPFRPHFEFMVAVILIGGVLYFGAGRLVSHPTKLGELRVLAVQPDIPQDPWGSVMGAGEALQRCMGLTEVALATGEPVDLLIWPETPIPESLEELPRFEEFQKRMVPRRVPAFLYGTILNRGFEVSNSAILTQQDEPFVQFYDKMHLVIMGEYVPFASTFPFLRKLVPLGVDFTPGKQARVMGLGLQWRLAPLICFEDILPRVARRFLPGDPHVFVNVTNDGWFQKSAQSWQHFQHARFRCIEFRRPMIRVANNGVTGWVDERGVARMILRDPDTGRLQFPGTLRMTVPMVETRTTFYARWGDWPGWLSLWLVLAAGVRAWVRSPLKRRLKKS